MLAQLQLYLTSFTKEEWKNFTIAGKCDII